MRLFFSYHMNLQAALKQVTKSRDVAQPKAAMNHSKKTSTSEKLATEKEARTTYIAPSRIDTRNITGAFSPEVHKQWSLLKVEQEKSGQELMAEALNDLFRKYHKSPIAQ